MFKKIASIILISTLTTLSITGLAFIQNNPFFITSNNSNIVFAASTNSYMFYDSDSRYLSESEIVDLSSWQLKIARNEIYARHGRLFNDDSLQQYFNSCYWYNGYISPNKFNENVLNKYEVYNIKLIKSVENGSISASSNGYIFYDSDSRYLSKSEIVNLSSWQLRVARNEIYARHGRLFNDNSLQQYFNSCSWYNGYISPSKFNENVLNKYEVYNIKLIKSYE